MNRTAVVSAGKSAMSHQADNDAQVIGLWLHGRSEHTQRAYRKDVERFLDFVGVGIAQVTLSMLQTYADAIAGQADTTRNRNVSAIKSLLSFAHRIGYTSFNVGVPLKAPAIKNRLAERILSESDVQRIIALEPSPRNRVLITLLYASGGRVSEVCRLTWKDCVERDDGGQVTLFGKGGKTRVVLISKSTWHAMESIRGSATDESPVFVSRKGGHLDASQVHRIVKVAAHRAGIIKNVSPHWLRHAHASHALDRGCPIHLVQATLGHQSVATTGRYIHARPTESSAKYLAV